MMYSIILTIANSLITRYQIDLFPIYENVPNYSILNLKQRLNRKQQYISVTVKQTKGNKKQMLATIDANKFIKALNAYNKSLKSPLHHTTNITNNNDLVTDLFNQDMLNALFQGKKGNKKDNYGQDFGNKDVVRCVQFFHDQNQPDKLLSGLNYKINQQQPHHHNAAFVIDLTRAFKQKFVVGKIIGQGAYAQVRIAIHRQSNKKVAIKVYQKQRISRTQRKRSILRQIRILQTMNHKNIVKILDVIQTNNHLNIVMQYLSGTPLSCFLKKQESKKLNQMQCKAVIGGLAQALLHMKNYNISHRDIKIQNVILDDQLNPKLIDFGFSTCVQIGKKVPLFCGTPNYMAPEIVLRKAFCGLKSDIWALGVLFFVIATGVYPFKGSTDQQLYKKITNLEFPSYLLDSNYKMAELIKLMLKFNPDQRITPEQILHHPWLNRQNKYYIISNKNRKKQASAVSPSQKKQRINTTLTSLSNYKQNTKTKTKTQSKIKIKSPVPKQQKRVNKFRQSLNNTLKPRNCNEKTGSTTSKSFINNNKGRKQKSKGKVYQKMSCQKSWNKFKQGGCRKLERSKSRSRLT